MDIIKNNSFNQGYNINNKPNPFLYLNSVNKQNMLNVKISPIEELLNKLKNSGLNETNGITIFNKTEMISLFGKDVCGVDICCVRNNDVVAINFVDIIMRGNVLSNFVNFLYSCGIVENKQGCDIKKIFISNVKFDESTLAAFNRNPIDHNYNDVNEILFNETVNYVKMLYGVS